MRAVTDWLDDTTLGAAAQWEDTTADPITNIRAVAATVSSGRWGSIR